MDGYVVFDIVYVLIVDKVNGVKNSSKVSFVEIKEVQENDTNKVIVNLIFIWKRGLY